MKTASIGIMREDGDFAVLATLNNNDEHLSVDVFKTLVEGVRTYMEAMSRQTVIVLERQDTPDYVTIEEK